jgi:hypothetical protein
MTAKRWEAFVSNPDLFPLLHKRMSHENQDVPQFIGEFDCVGALPKGEYPAIYYWFDREHGCVRLSFNTPMLSCWCVEEAHRAGIDVDASDVAVLEAIDKLRQVATPAFQHMLTSMDPRSER